MIDMHTHILPKTDDGATNENMAIKMLKIAMDDGISDIVATPHYISGESDYDSASILKKCNILSQKAGEFGIGIRIYSGCEAMICPRLPEMVEEGSICTINNSKYVLIELPMMGIPEYTYDVIFRLRLKGYVPIIAHPERNMDIFERPNKLQEFIQRGALSQLNSTSILGFHGEKIRRLSIRLLRRGMIHFISTDAHSDRIRSPKLSKARIIVEKELGKDNAEVLFVQNGRAVLENSLIKTIEPQFKKANGIFVFMS